MTAAKPTVDVVKALRGVYPSWDTMQPRSRQLHVAHVTERWAAGKRAWVKGRPLVKRRGVPDPIARETPLAHPGAPIVGYRDTYLMPDGTVVNEDDLKDRKPTAEKDPS
ncbi:hypothetical protein LGT39_12520 [Demequina sp. TTPB684]|uniref:hypothetical protein n=1 Tax=unclassified Demequina TaxID=2620311 RepID=UPI001CF342CC|nr:MULTISPECIES: hypothetical protein [unclassified Demequina]MCB2413669.1 hypothetical protein [Demequina sp. TTPB684]UPU87731.1 hypothetical protein LGT36_010775 [Demequina sp. TMPB413]